LKSIDVLRGCRWNHWQNGGYWLLFTLVGGLFPLYAGFLFLLIFSTINVTGFIDHGEFVIYSAGLLPPALLIIFSDYRDPFPNRALWGLIAISLLIVCTVVFGAMAAVQFKPELQKDIDIEMLRVVSVMLFGVTTVLAFLLIVLDSVMPGIEEIAEQRSGDLNSLEDQFTKLGRS
jgi:hypothetical protein